MIFNWNNCLEAAFTGEYPPQAFACDEIAAGTANGAYETVIMTEANNPIRGHHTYSQTQVYIDRFTQLLKSHNSAGRSYFFTSWEGLSYHDNEWTDEIAGELAEYYPGI